MAKSTPSAAAQLIFDELSFDLTTEAIAPGVATPVPAPSPLAAAVAPGTDLQLMSRVDVNPLVLSRAIILATAFATEHGLGTQETEQLAIFVREDDVLVAADFDRAGTRTMRFRFKVPIVGAPSAGETEWAGMTVRGIDLLQALRNRLENSDRYGILSGDTPVTLELYASADRAKPAELRVLPKTPGALQPRIVKAQDGADLAQFDDIEPLRADAGLPELSAESLIETAAATDVDVGLLLDPRGGQQTGILAGAGTGGVMLTAFKGAGLAHHRETADVSPTRALRGPVVLSQRLARAAGHAQAAMAGALELQAKVRNNEHVAHAVVAALAATLETATTTQAQEALEATIGEKAAAAALRAGQKSDSALEGAVASARSLVAGLSMNDALLVARLMRERLGAAASQVSQAVSDMVREIAGDETTVVGVAEALVAGAAQRERIEHVAASARGHVDLRQEVKAVVSRLASAKADEQITLADLAVAAVRLRGTKSGSLADVVLPLVLPEQREAWWATFATYLEALKVPLAARESILARRRTHDAAPTTAALVLPDALRKEWLRTAAFDAAGRFWAGSTDGRVYAGIGDDDIGTLMLSDVAVRPDPAQFPVTPAEIETMLSRSTPFAWKGQLYNSDLDVASNRIAGLAPTDSGTGALGKRATTLFVARWTPPEFGRTVDSSTARVLEMFENARDREPVSTDVVYLGEGAQRRAMSVVRSAKEPLADVVAVGTLRVFGFDVTGERLYMEIPMKSVLHSGANPLAFALDAERLHDFVGFVTRKGPQQGAVTLLDASETGVRLASPDGSRVVVIPTVSVSVVPPTLQALVNAAGVTNATPVTSLQAVTRVRALPDRVRSDVVQPAVTRFAAWKAADPVVVILPRPAQAAKPTRTKPVSTKKRKTETEFKIERMEAWVDDRLAKGLPRDVIVSEYDGQIARAQDELAALENTETRPRLRDETRDSTQERLRAAAAAQAREVVDLSALMDASYETGPSEEKKRRAGTKTNKMTAVRTYLTYLIEQRSAWIEFSTAAAVAGGLRVDIGSTPLLGQTRSEVDDRSLGGTELFDIGTSIVDGPTAAETPVSVASPVAAPRPATQPVVKARLTARRM
jgi:hypothetical protein